MDTQVVKWLQLHFLILYTRETPKKIIFDLFKCIQDFMYFGSFCVQNDNKEEIGTFSEK